MTREAMIRKSTAGLLVVLGLHGMIAPSARADPQEGVRIFGYYEPQIDVMVLDGETAQMFSNKLRIDLAASVNGKVTFGGNFDFITYHGRTAYLLPDFLPGSVVDDVPPGVRDRYVLAFADTLFLDNVYLKIAFDYFDLTLGKLQISPGAGYAWNPTDMFNIKDILDPTYERRGHNAVRADIPIGTLGTAMMIYEPERDFDRSGKYANVKLHAGHFDLSLAGGERFAPFSDYVSGVAYTERRRMAGGDFSGELLGLGVWGEGAYNFMEMSDDYFEGLLGTDYTFENGFYLLNELYINGQGEADYRDYDFNDWMRYLTAETKALCRGQWYLFASCPATDLLTVGGSIVTSLSDGSLVLVPTIEYNASTNLDITFFGNIYIGEEGKAFSSALGQGGLLRARYYF